MFEKAILHVDVNSAFLSWEAVFRLYHLGASLDLREAISAVGGDIKKRHGIILAKSIPAKRYGIHTGEAISEALRKCPQLILVPPHYELYQKSSLALIKLLREYTDQLEQYSVDEAYLDVSESASLYGDPVELAENIRKRVAAELGFTVNIGVASNKLLAKMASDFEKPNRVHTLYNDEIMEKMWPLPVKDLFFVGRATIKKLHTLGIETIGQLALSDLNLIKAHLKKHGEVIWNFANGIDDSLVEREPEPNKGYGNSITISRDVSDEKTAKMILLSLAETVAGRLRKDQVKVLVVSVGIKDYLFQYASHQMVLSAATNITNEIYETACCLFDELWNHTPIRLLGIYTSRVTRGNTPRQLRRFDYTDYDKLVKLDEAVDEIRRCYGKDALKRAAFVGKQPSFPHMAGGISEDKYRVDYKKVELY